VVEENGSETAYFAVNCQQCAVGRVHVDNQTVCRLWLKIEALPKDLVRSQCND
jgi:hypothetical protein